jgi:hypothetical protein
MCFVSHGLLLRRNRVQMYEKIPIYAIEVIKNIFFNENIWSYQKNVVPLHPEL